MEKILMRAFYNIMACYNSQLKGLLLLELMFPQNWIKIGTKLEQIDTIWWHVIQFDKFSGDLPTLWLEKYHWYKLHRHLINGFDGFWIPNVRLVADIVAPSSPYSHIQDFRILHVILNRHFKSLVWGNVKSVTLQKLRI